MMLNVYILKFKADYITDVHMLIVFSLEWAVISVSLIV